MSKTDVKNDSRLRLLAVMVIGFIIGVTGYGATVAYIVSTGVAVWLSMLAVSAIAAFIIGLFRPVANLLDNAFKSYPLLILICAIAIGFLVGVLGYGKVGASIMASFLGLWIAANLPLSLYNKDKRVNREL